MLLQKLRSLFSGFLFQREFEGKNDQAQDEHENTNPVDPVHITNPFCFGLIGIRFPDIEILRYLPEDSHLLKVILVLQHKKPLS